MNRVVVLRPGPFSVRFGARTALVCVVLTLAAFGAGVLALGSGEFEVPPGEVIQALAGQGSGATRLVIVEWRLPRVLLALIIGAALGLSGAVFQTLLRNPLGSPDVIGFNTGAYTGVLVMMLLVGRDYTQTAAGALIGGLAAAAVVYVLSHRHGVHGFRLIVVGIAISAILGSLNQWLVIKAQLQLAIAAAVWGQGSLNTVSWDQVPPVAVAVALLTAGLMALGPRLSLLAMGDEPAAGLGVRTERTRLTYLVIGVALTAVATAAAGPIAFVALAAPQLARLLTRTAGIALAPSAAMGALLLTASDWLGQRLFAPTQLPVGIVTVSLGGLYFAWLLARPLRKGDV